MPKYEVIISEIERYRFEIEAGNESEATDLAWEKLTSCTAQEKETDYVL